MMPFYEDIDFVPDRAIGYLLRRVHLLGQQALLPAYALGDLTATQWSTLAMIGSGTVGTCAALARDLGHDKGAMTRVLDQLQDRGLIERERAHGDRRVVNARLTEEGTATMERIKRRMIEQWNVWLEDWPRERTERFIADLVELRTKMERTVEGNECA